jgi:hypothetical protein
MKHVPPVLAVKAQGQTLLGADRNMYESQKNPTTHRWRWVRVEVHAVGEGPKKSVEKASRAESKPQSKSQSQPTPRKSVIPDEMSAKLLNWRLTPAPSELRDLPTMTPELENTLRAKGISSLGALYSQVFITQGDFAKFTKTMRELGLDKASIQLIFDKFAGQVASDLEAETASQPEGLDVEAELVAALKAVPEFAQLYEIIKPKRPKAGGFVFAIGLGGQALVFEGRERGTDKKLAIKIEYGQSQSLNKELNLMARIKQHTKHPKHINLPIDAFVLPRHLTNLSYNALAVLSPFLEGCDRFEEAAKSEFAKVLDGCAQALEEVHSAAIVHCDVTPNNFCVDNKDGHVWIIDFGLARLIKHQKGRETEFFGTPRFASLAAHLKKAQGFRDDLEALAYTMYKPLTGKDLPWASAKGTEASIEKAIVQGKKKPPEEIRDYITQCRELAIDEMPKDYPKFVSVLLENL